MVEFSKLLDSKLTPISQDLNRVLLDLRGVTFDLKSINHSFQRIDDQMQALEEKVDSLRFIPIGVGEIAEKTSEILQDLRSINLN